MENYFNKIIEIFVKSSISKNARDEFHQWLIKDKFSGEKENALGKLWDTLEENHHSDITPDLQRPLHNIYKKVGQQQHQQHIKVPKYYRFWQISAACLLIAFLSTLFYKPNIKLENPDLIEQFVPIAKTTTLTLPDGTEVQMNSTATLLYPTQFSGETRSVYLIGEANFKVAKDEKKPFIVKSDDFQVTALGTEFNMKVYPDSPILSATLLSGSVEVRFNNLEKSVRLKPNEQFTYHKHTKEESIILPDISDITAWQRGELVFKSATLEEIISSLERKYPYSFVYSLNTLRDDKYTFRFKDSTPLQEIMNIIVEVSGNLKYRIEDDKYFISPLQ